MRVWAVTHILGQAKQVWRNAQLDVNTLVLTFASLTDVFRAGLGIHNDEWEAREKLHNLSQAASVKAYARKFMTLPTRFRVSPWLVMTRSIASLLALGLTCADYAWWILQGRTRFGLLRILTDLFSMP